MVHLLIDALISIPSFESSLFNEQEATVTCIPICHYNSTFLSGLQFVLSQHVSKASLLLWCLNGGRWWWGRGSTSWARGRGRGRSSSPSRSKRGWRGHNCHSSHGGTRRGRGSSWCSSLRTRSTRRLRNLCIQEESFRFSQ